jgi:hypothetical protein
MSPLLYIVTDDLDHESFYLDLEKVALDEQSIRIVCDWRRKNVEIGHAASSKVLNFITGVIGTEERLARKR